MPSFQEIVRDLVAKQGQGTIADRVGMDPTRFCRALSGQGGFKEKEIDALIELADYELAQRGYKKYYMALMFTLIEFINHLKECLDEKEEVTR